MNPLGSAQDINKFHQDHKTTRFVVQNISREGKTINIFEYPIEYGQTRDLLSIPMISEADIRFHLLKGEIIVKLYAEEIAIVFTNIDLLQFDDSHKAFLKAHGVIPGTEIGEGQLTPELLALIESGGSGVLPFRYRENITLLGAKNNLNRTFNTPDKFINSDNYLGNALKISIKHNGRVLDSTCDYDLFESVPSGDGTAYDTIVLKTFTPSPNSRLFCDYVILP